MPSKEMPNKEKDVTLKEDTKNAAQLAEEENKQQEEFLVLCEIDQENEIDKLAQKICETNQEDDIAKLVDSKEAQELLKLERKDEKE